MQVREGDTVGLKDQRYGTVSFLVTQNHFLVDIFPDVNEPNPDTPEQVWTNIDNVASIV